MGHALAITGLGCIGAPGVGLTNQRRALASGYCGLACHADPDLPLAKHLPVGRVTGGFPRFPSRTTSLAMAAAREALTGVTSQQRRDCAIVVGSSVAGLCESERDFLTHDMHQVFPSYRRQQSHRLGRALGEALGCGGLQSTHSVACASAAAAIAEAAELVRAGTVPMALAVGTDALTRLTMSGFASLQLIDDQGCRPLTNERHGMSLGEGAAALLIEDADHARQRGAMVSASLLGWGVRTDGYHATRPDPAGTHLEHAIRAALNDAGLTPANVGYVSAHGTGTADNDPCEVAVLAKVFGDVPTASCKRTYGHTLGASAALEAVASCLALIDQQLWPSAGAEVGTPLAGVDVVRTRRSALLDAVCSTTLAFGGVNAALIFGRGERVA